MPLSKELENIMVLVADLPEKWQKKAADQLISLLNWADKEASEEALPTEEKLRVRAAQSRFNRERMQPWLDRLNAAIAEIKRMDEKGP